MPASEGISAGAPQADLEDIIADSMARRAKPLSTVQDLLDRAMISDQVYRYMKGLDTRDFTLVMSTLQRPFHMQAGQLGVDRPLLPEEYVLLLGPAKFLPGFDVTVHISTNHLITLDGDDAHVETKLYACHYIQEEGVDRRDIGGNHTPAVNIHCNKQMPWEGWLTRQPDGSWMFRKIRMGTFASEGDTRAFDISLKRSGHI